MSSAAVAVGTVSTTSLAGERLLPVDPHLAPLLRQPGNDHAGHTGLVRGQVIHCAGTAPWSLALALVAEAARCGAWLATVDVPDLGVEAAAELGISLERLVRVETGSAGHWPEVMGAVLDGFEVVVTVVPGRVPAPAGRRVQQRIRATGAVVVVVPAPGSPTSTSPALPADVRVSGSGRAAWEGLGDGHGHLRARRLVVEATGRRVPRPRTAELWLPGPSGGIEAVDGEQSDPVIVGDDDLLQEVS